ncbi:MAG TPA: 30S ribosomal protein S6 [Anaerolineae bacterium]
MSRSYELTFIVKPDLDATSLTAVIDKVKEIITTENGSITRLDQWGLRRLMYPIRKLREGQYVFVLVELDAQSIVRIENRLRLTEDIIRYLLIRADEAAPAPVPAPATEQTVEATIPEAPAVSSEAAPETATS